MRARLAAWARQRAVQQVLAVLAVVAAVLVVAEVVDPTNALVALALVVFASTVVLVTREQLGSLGRRVEEVGIGPASLKFAADARVAAHEAEPDEDIEAADGTVDLVQLRLKLDQKLAYIAKHLLARRDDAHGEPIPTYVTVGSLAYDGLISDEQARTLARLLTLSEREFARLPRDLATQIADDARTVVAILRLTVFRNHVRNELGRHHWAITSVMKVDDRSVFVAARDERSEDRRLVLPVFAMGTSTGRITSARSSLERSGQRGPAVIVVPDDWHGDTGTDARAPVARGVRELLAMMGHPLDGAGPRGRSATRGVSDEAPGAV